MVIEYNIDEIDPNEVVHSSIGEDISPNDLFVKVIISSEIEEDPLSTWDLVGPIILSEGTFLNEEFSFASVNTVKSDGINYQNTIVTFKYNNKISDSQTIDILSDLEDSIREEIKLDDYVNYSIEI